MKQPVFYRMALQGEYLKYLVSLLVLQILLIGCTPPVPAVSPAESAQPSPAPTSREQSVGANLGQELPIEAEVKVGDQIIQLEVAKTVEQKAMGLMYRKELADNRGMLFPFDSPRLVGFWMKNCLINLDMVFLRDGKVEAISKEVPPCTAEPCPTYGPAVPIDQVIELRGGRADELGLKVGDRLTVKYL
jgi:uncharacterized membrane protein (UPF0127 family)